MIHGDSGRMIAIVAPSYGKWTVAVDGAPWAARFGGMVTDTVFSPDGQSVAALGVENDIYRVVVDDVVWPEKFDMAWAPVFSPDGKRIAAKVEKNGRYTIALNGKLWSRPCQAVGQPIFSPDGSRLLIKSIEDGRYYRRVIDVKDIV
jgi:Tol biopolymer transport system component